MEKSNRKIHTVSQILAQSAIQGLLENIRIHQVSKVLAVKAQKQMGCQFMLTQQNNCRQLCPNMKYHRFAPLKQDLGINLTIKQPIRPMSATCNKIRVRKQQISAINSKKQTKCGSSKLLNVKKQTVFSTFSSASINDKVGSLSKTQFMLRDSEKCVKIKTDFNQDEQLEIQKLREQKQKQEIQNKKRQNFLETINTDNKIFQRTQGKFLNSIGQKDITYSYKGDVIELKKRKVNFTKSNGASRISFRDKTQKKDRPFTAKTISIVYKPSQGKKIQQIRQTEILDCQDYTQKNFKASQNTKFTVIR